VKENKLSDRMCRLIEQAICQVLQEAAQLKECFRLDVRVHAVAVVESRPLCVSMRLISTQNKTNRIVARLLKDKWGRSHFPEVLLMESCDRDSTLRVMYNAEYHVYHAMQNNADWERFSQTVKYVKDLTVDHTTQERSIVENIISFLVQGLFDDKPYPGFQPT